MNPYARLAAARAIRHAITQPATGVVETKPVPRKVEEFFGAMEINHACNRARVCTGIAHTMCKADLEEAIRRLEADAQASSAKLESLNAPAIIVQNERKKYQPAIKILERVLANR